MRWNTVLFDLDGTVTDPKEGITCAVAYALRQQGIIADPDTLTSFIGPPLHESFPELFGLTEEKTDRAVEDFRVYFSRQGWAENIPYKGMAELLESLQGAGLKLVIATSKPEEFAIRIMEHFGLAAYFHRICGAQGKDRSSAQKGSVVADALRRSGTDGPAVMVGDRRFDVAGALIEQAQLKGVRVGGACVSEKHAGFVVNTGGATAQDVRALIALIQKRVFETSGFHLQPEVRIW